MQRPQEWAWSSLRAHLDGCKDGLVTVAPLLERLGSVTTLIDTEPEDAALAPLRAAELTGRPVGSDDFVTARSPGPASPAAREAGTKNQSAREWR